MLSVSCWYNGSPVEGIYYPQNNTGSESFWKDGVPFFSLPKEPGTPLDPIVVISVVWYLGNQYGGILNPSTDTEQEEYWIDGVPDVYLWSNNKRRYGNLLLMGIG